MEQLCQLKMLKAERLTPKAESLKRMAESEAKYKISGACLKPLALSLMPFAWNGFCSLRV